MQDAVERVSEEIRKLHREKNELLIAIDGRCASGKTTLAEQLQKELSCSVIHMDHFFLRKEQRTQERLREPGGNVDYERFEKEVLEPVRAGRSFSYRPYDCHLQELSAPIQIEHNSVCIVEGSYACHPRLWGAYDFHIFLTVDPETQMRRILFRNKEEDAVIFRNKWIPLEESYFSYYHIMERCELCIRT